LRDHQNHLIASCEALVYADTSLFSTSKKTRHIPREKWMTNLRLRPR
jgi:hypothetical protein